MLPCMLMSVRCSLFFLIPFFLHFITLAAFRLYYDGIRIVQSRLTSVALAHSGI